MNFERLAPLLLSLAAAGLTGRAAGPPRPEDEEEWRDLAHLAARHDLEPLLHAGLAAAGAAPPGPVGAALRRAALAAEIRCDRAWDQLEPVIAALNAAGIEPLVLKGALFAVRYYPTPGLRLFSDLDLMVPLAARDRSADLLLGLGYQDALPYPGWDRRYYAEKHNHWVFDRPGGLRLELHWALTPPCSEIRLDAPGIWARSTPFSCRGGTARALSGEDEALHIAVHAAKHQMRMPLRQYVDLAALLTAIPAIDGSELRRRAAAAGATTDLEVFLAVFRTLWPCPAGAGAAIEGASGGSRYPLADMARYAVEWPFFDHPHSLIELAAADSAGAAARAVTGLVTRRPAAESGAQAGGRCAGEQSWLGKLRGALAGPAALRRHRGNIRAAAAIRRMFQGREAP